MAVATSLAPVALPEKLPKMASTAEVEGLNGSAEMNGHASPNGVTVDAKSDSTPNGTNAESPAPKTAEVNHQQNHDAFTSNQTVPSEKDKEVAGEKTVKVPEKSSDGEKPKEEEKLDAPAQLVNNQTTEDKSLETAEVSMEEAAEDDQPAESNTKPEEPTEQSTKVAVDAASPALSAAPESNPEHPDQDSAASPSAAEPKDDIEMTDAPESVDKPSGADKSSDGKTSAPENGVPAVSTQETQTQDTTASIEIGESQVSQAAPSTADTSLSGVPMPTKVARERDDDDEDEPLAKRARLDHSDVAKKEEVKAGTSTPKGDAMEVDHAVQESGASLDSGNEPKYLGHPSLDNTPITEWQNRQLRTILTGVKKTKAGNNFKLSVESMWPQLWADYAARIEHPMDISLIERKLRSETDPYPDMAAFKADVNLIVQNAVTFNGEAHDVTQSAYQLRDSITQRMKSLPASEPMRPEKKETAKNHPKRHAEPRAPAQSAAIPPPPKKPKAAPAVQVEKPAVVESPAFAIPPGNNGVPVIRRDSAKTADNRPKRPVVPPKSKDLVYDAKKRKKLSPELKFCEVVLEELKKIKYWDINNAFTTPVDPVALNIPNYHKIIKKPMDLGTMTTKLQAGDYSNAKEFEKDFNLIIKNCKDFNGDDHPVTHASLKLQELFREEWKRKDDFIAKNAPASTVHAAAVATSPQAKDDSEDDDADSEPEPVSEEVKKSTARLENLQKRLAEEQAKVNDEMNSAKPDATAVEVSQSVISTLQMAIIKERTKLNEETAKAKPKAKPAKSRKSTSGAAASASKKAASGATAGGNKKAGGTKKAPKQRKMGNLEKEIIAEGIMELDGKDLEKSIDIIRRDTGQGENDSGELELDIESLSNEALVKLFEIISKAFPELVRKKEAAHAAEVAAHTSSAANQKAKPAKTKKNKPMSRSEQERRIQQLSQLRAQAQRAGSGSQEPMESIEGNGSAPATEAAPPEDEHDSGDEESSEEE